MGHRKKSCPYVVRSVLPCKEAELRGASDKGASSHVVRAANNTEVEVGLYGKEHDAVRENVHEGSYGPWMVMACKKNGTKTQRSGEFLPDQGSAFELRNNSY